MKRHLFFFRPGEEARMLARLQFGASEDGSAGAILTYPIKGMPWRRNVMRSYQFSLDAPTLSVLFSEPKRIQAEFPASCLSGEALWSDSTEKANGITRDRATGTLCYTIGIMVEYGEPEEYFALRENDPALTQSVLFQVISKLVTPYERL
jgi:hypothetical protein